MAVLTLILAGHAGFALAAPGRPLPAAAGLSAEAPAPTGAGEARAAADALPSDLRIGADCAGLAGAERHACVYVALSKVRTSAPGATVPN